MYHTRVGGSYLYSLHLFDHILAVTSGKIDGDMSYIETICTHGRQLIQDQFSRGVLQDFPIEERRDKEISLKPKPKKVGHKGGRGGKNVPKREEIQADPFDDGGDDHVNDVGGVGGVGETYTHTHNQGDDAERHEPDTRVVDSISHDSFFPNFDLLPPGDYLWMSNDATSYHSTQPLPPHEQIEIVPTLPCSHPTFYLMTQSPKPLQQPIQHMQLVQQQQEPHLVEQQQEPQLVEQQQP